MSRKPTSPQRKRLPHDLRKSQVQNQSGDKGTTLYAALRALGHVDSDVVSVSTKGPGDSGRFTAETRAVESLRDWTPPDDANVWFSANPLRELMPPGVRGGVADVRRGQTLYADLDVAILGVKAKGLASIEDCEKVVAELAHALGVDPAVVIYSGHGVQPIWRVDDAQPITDNAVAWNTISLRWSALVRQVVHRLSPEAGVDSVFNIDRILRCPGTVNWKDPQHPVPVQCSINAEAGGIDIAVLDGLLPALESADVTVAAVHAKASLVEGNALFERFRGGAMSPAVVARVNCVIDAIEAGADRHKTMNDATMALVRLGANGERGVPVALSFVETAFSEVAAENGHDLEEFSRSLKGALRTVAADPNRRDPSDADCGAAFGPEGSWGPGSKWAAIVVDGERLWQRTRGEGSGPAISDRAPLTQSLADVVPKKVDWLWWPWIPRGKLTIFEGEPDVGKSTMTLTWAAMVTNGGPWPISVVGGRETHNEKGLKEPGSVVLVGVEDDLADTVVPRLIAAGADRSRIVTMVQPTDGKGTPVPFLIPDDVERLRRSIEEVDAKLVIVDPITAFMSDAVKPGSDTANRKALMTLASVAERTGAAIVLVRHLNKGTGMSAKHRGGGSIAFTALARSALLAAKLPDNDERENTDAAYGLASIKGNLSRAPQTMGYRLESSRDDPDSPVVLWAGQLDENADQLVGADGTKVDARKAAPARDQAARMIKEVLADGPMPAKQVRKIVSDETGCSEKTVANAASNLLIVKKQVRGDDGAVTHWEWELPPTALMTKPSKKTSNKVARNG